MIARSFFTKLFLGNLLVIGIIIGVGGWVSYRQLNVTHLAEVEAHQERLLAFAQRYMERIWPGVAGQVEPIDRECKALGNGSSLRVTVVADDGRVLGDSEADPRRMQNHRTPDRPEVMVALGGLPGRNVRSSETLGVKFRYLARPIRQGDRIVGVVRMAMPVRAIAESQEVIRSALLWAAGAAAAVAGVLALLLSWIWYAPLRQITRTARTLAAGDLSQGVAIAGSDELAQLAAALNRMRGSLSAKIAQIAAQRQELAAVVENLREGVIGLDGGGHILLMNASAVDLLAAGGGEVTGKHLQAVVRIPEIVDIHNDIAGNGKPITRQVEAQSRGRRCVLDVHAARLAEGSAERLAVLLVVRDVSDLVRTATVKAEFVANASHELRTPLATIRAAVDSLRALEPGQAGELARLVEILDRHTTRLEEMTNDLLSLHLVESTRHRLRLERIDLRSLVAWVQEHFRQRASQKSIALTAECSDPSAELRCDATLIQLILQNLLDNAIKFTPAGGEVTCRFEAGDDQVVICVRDTGCGIAPEIQDRVFERFFQADTSRSGEPRIRGTGLGLAIVKHAAERLGAPVKLQSEPGRGTAVTVTIPKQAAP
jgi:two-component system phosphate regulon sensor histidine kinase PhoR